MLSLYQVESINQIIRELDEFYKNTGLKVNFDKSVIIRVDNRKEKRITLKLDKELQWKERYVETLGIIIDLDNLNDIQHENLKKTLIRAEEITKSWQNRQLSLIGKVQVVNSLICSLFVYRLQVLPLLTKEAEARIIEIITRFIWNARKPKIRYRQLTLDYQDGGLKLANIGLRDKVLKIEWVRSLLQDNDETIEWLAYSFLDYGLKDHLI